MDGITLSNTYLLEKQFDWTDIVAEPNPVHWEAIRENRHCLVSRECVTERSGESVAFLVAANSEYSRMESVVPDDSHEKEGRRGDVRRILVQTLSLNDLLEHAGTPADPDFLLIDTEGSELLILKSL
ncbi:MAG: FkbM family methyltransferase [Luteolibacter sp.]